MRTLSTLSILAVLAGAPALAQDAHDLAKQLANPVASLISVPFQLNHDSGYGPDDGNRTVLNIQSFFFSPSTPGPGGIIWGAGPMFLLPTASDTTKAAWSSIVNSESSYDWKAEEWTVPVNFMVAKVTHIGKQPAAFGAVRTIWADAPTQAYFDKNWKLEDIRKAD